jgi:hypothetical protein
MPAFEHLASQAEELFQFVVQSGFTLASRQVLSPESFKGGFALRFVSEHASLQVEYSDLELAVHLGTTELFGPSVHPSFAGNSFSPEHLAEHLPAIAERVREGLSSFGVGAA